ncbi:hypothetical protein GGI18_000933 [Coemansia linderi]|uniref:Uncharacterized protein n=1 Tax=Coemansia linderi TaxID=2663919 RepID=A0ACC1KMW5_9FUNG|nr:hypothetical protein GGI18_000933 [Coemansia linderi]
MTRPTNSGAVLIGKRQRADSCNAVAAPGAEGELLLCEAKRRRIRARHEEHGAHWKPVPHPDLWPAEHPPNTARPVELTNSPGDDSHMHYDSNFSHHACQALRAVSLATPATSPPSQGVLSPIDDCDGEDMDQDMEEEDDDDASDIDPNSEYYHINMFLKLLHDEREMRRQQRLAASGGSGSR